jgi:hypothetical protein
LGYQELGKCEDADGYLDMKRERRKSDRQTAIGKRTLYTREGEASGGELTKGKLTAAASLFCSGTLYISISDEQRWSSIWA